ncbi:uncharacterized protein LOC103833433 isoform X2 [Brassica rapa]|uniref:uncharacterized protein LOC103833433 isoform X2 n=1 Tax=Brassica campestris TaxID=3711 RepID=UPI00142DC1BA|nr:uncharacterized protein LOC103833433 isoform X2 [Brassica rapa]
MFSYNRRHWSTKQDIRQICTAKPLRSKHKMKKNNKRKLMLNSVTVIKKEKHQKSMKGIHLRKNKKNKWKLIQKLKSPCKLKGRNEEEEVSHHNTVLEQEHKKNKEKRKDEAYEKAKEKFQDEDGSKLDKLIQMLYDLNKQVEVIENVLGVTVMRVHATMMIQKVHQMMKMKKKKFLVVKEMQQMMKMMKKKFLIHSN